MFIPYCSVKFIIERIPLESRKKTILILTFKQKIKKSQKQLSTTKVLSTAKDPANYDDRQVEKYEQVPIDIILTRPTMVFPKAADQIASEKQVEKRKMLEKQLIENTIKMNKIKKTK